MPGIRIFLVLVCGVTYVAFLQVGWLALPVIYGVLGLLMLLIGGHPIDALTWGPVLVVTAVTGKYWDEWKDYLP